MQLITHVANVMNRANDLTFRVMQVRLLVRFCSYRNSIIDNYCYFINYIIFVYKTT